MTAVANLILLAVSFYMLAKGADLFVDGAAGVATKLRIPQIIIGLTIVAMGTSAPEAAVSISSAIGGNADITIGNIVGSNILNILIILGISSVITTLAVTKNVSLVDTPVMLGATVLLLVLGFDGTISLFDALILLLVFIVYMAYLFIVARKNIQDEGSAEEESGSISLKKTLIILGFVTAVTVILGLVKTVKVHEALIVAACFALYAGNLFINASNAKKGIEGVSIVRSLLMTAVGLAIIIFGSNFAVDSATALARQIGISDRFIGLTVVALGTSLPELFTSVVAARKNNADIAIGNIVGSNIFNILFIVGLSGIILPVPFPAPFIIDTIVALAAGLLLWGICLAKGKLGKVSGILMLLGYAAYFVYLLMI